MGFEIADETRLHIAKTGDAYRIRFYVDTIDSTDGPWQNCGAVPMVVYAGRLGMDTEPARGFDLLDPFACMSDSKIKAKLAEIVEAAPATLFDGSACYSDPESFDSFVRDEYPGLTLREARREWFADYLGDGEASQDRLEMLARLWTIAGVPAAVHQSRGYSQGDWAALLVVAHPEAVKQWGFSYTKRGKEYADFSAYLRQCPDDLKEAAKDWGAWAWGGVIGFLVDWIDPQEAERAKLELDPKTISPAALNALVRCEFVTGCGGFYPDHDSDYFPLDKNHAETISEAVAEAEADAKERAKVRAAAFAAEMLGARPDLAPQYSDA